MDTSGRQQRNKGRTTFLTVAAVAGVLLAGGAAIGANANILNAADRSEIGDLSAAGDLVPSSVRVVDVYADGSATTVAAPAQPGVAAGRQFTVTDAGTVAVVDIPGGLRLGVVTPQPGWSWSTHQDDDSSLTVTFSDGARTLVLAAHAAPDGTVEAAVHELPAATITTPTSARPHDAERDGEAHEGRDDDD